MSQLAIVFALAFFSVCVGVAILLSRLIRSNDSPAEHDPARRVMTKADYPLPRPVMAALHFIWPAIVVLARPCQTIYSAMPVSRQRQLLASAGFDEEFSEGHWLACRVLLGLIAAIFPMILLYLNRLPFNWLPLMFATAAMLFATQWLYRCARNRRAELLEQLPFCIDLMVICLESGLNLSAAIEQTILQGPKGVLSRELQKIPARQRSGLSLRQALQLLGQSCSLPQIDSFINSMVTAQASGSDLGQVLIALAQQIRDEVYFEAEQRAMRTPVKMLAPLLLFVFPCTFLILFFPIAMRLFSEGIFR